MKKPKTSQTEKQNSVQEARAQYMHHKRIESMLARTCIYLMKTEQTRITQKDQSIQSEPYHAHTMLVLLDGDDLSRLLDGERTLCFADALVHHIHHIVD